MKIVATDNFDRETVDDVLVCENVNAHYGDVIVEALNARIGDYGPWFYKVVPDDYQLRSFEP